MSLSRWFFLFGILILMGASEVSLAADSNLPQTKRKSRARPPENEGTKAPNRFESDLFLKSKYHINGQQLEVDPD